MKKTSAAVLAVLACTLFVVGCDESNLVGPSVVVASTAPKAETEAEGAKKDKKTKTPTATATATSTATPTATAAPTATPLPTRNPLATPTSGATNDPDVLKLIGPAACVIYLAPGADVVDYVFTVDGANVGRIVGVTLVFGNIAGDAVERDFVADLPSGVYPRPAPWPAGHPPFMWLVGASGGASFISDRCAIATR